VHAISSKVGSGIEELSPYLQPGRTVALLGSSGVGKSTLINRLVGRERQLTRDVREKDSRGRHTTTHRELVPLPGGALLIDTPGMRELQLWSAEEGVQETFDDITALAEHCYFRDCRHETEPRCAVKAAAVDGRLASDRLESFLKLQEELRHLATRPDALAQQTEKKQNRMIHRAMRRMPPKG
jgi:ribosome biogenesis GTPase